MEWFKANWATILAAVPVTIAVLSVINRATVHWSTLQGSWWKRVLPVALYMLTELLSVAQSANSPGRWKLPLTSVPPTDESREVIKVTK